jgi:hypothetical protein
MAINFPDRHSGIKAELIGQKEKEEISENHQYSDSLVNSTQ